MRVPGPVEHAGSADVRTWEALGMATPQRPALAVEIHARLPSTNDLALERARRQLPIRPTLIMADRQSAGRGSGGRQWYSGHEGLYLSLLLPRVHAPPEHLSKFALLAGLALCETLEALPLAVAPQVKWPNDVLISGAKVAGILVESSARTGSPDATQGARPGEHSGGARLLSGASPFGDDNSTRDGRAPASLSERSGGSASAGLGASATLPLVVGIGLNLSSPKVTEDALGPLETPATFLADHLCGYLAGQVPLKPWLVNAWLERFFSKLTQIPRSGWQPVIHALNDRLWGRGQRVVWAPHASMLGASTLEVRHFLGLDAEGYPQFESPAGPSRRTQGRLVALAR